MHTLVVADEDFDVIRRAWANTNDIDEDAYRELVHDDVEIVPFGAAMEGKSYRGVEGVLEWLREEIHSNWDVFETIPEDFRRVGDRILVTGHWHARGKGSGVELDMPATWIIRMREGKIAYWRTYTDRDEALRDIGADD